MHHSLFSLVPDAADLLALEVEELGGVLLVHLNSAVESAPNDIFQQGLTTLKRVLGHDFARRNAEYGTRQPDVDRALTEAWARLQSEAFLVEDQEAGTGWFFLSRRAQRLKTKGDFAAYRKPKLLPKGQLHPLIASKVYPAFLRGEYDTAIFQALREVEVAVRERGGFQPDKVGVPLMRLAFKPVPKPSELDTPGPLADVQLPLAEQEAMANLFSGAIGLYKNPHSHRHVPANPEEAAEVIALASQLLRIVDRLKPQTWPKSPEPSRPF